MEFRRFTDGATMEETGHPVFTSVSALSRGILRKVKGNEAIHFNADASNTELFSV